MKGWGDINISSRESKKITEAIYLCTANTNRYRVIIRIAYKKYEKMKYSLYKEEIFEDIKKINGFDEYTLDELKQDLEALETWGNFCYTGYSKN